MEESVNVMIDNENYHGTQHIKRIFRYTAVLNIILKNPVSINQSKHCEKQFSVFGSKGGQISPLMHVPLLCRSGSDRHIKSVWLYRRDNDLFDFFLLYLL